MIQTIVNFLLNKLHFRQLSLYMSISIHSIHDKNFTIMFKWSKLYFTINTHFVCVFTNFNLRYIQVSFHKYYSSYSHFHHQCLFLLSLEGNQTKKNSCSLLFCVSEKPQRSINSSFLKMLEKLQLHL